MIVTRGLQQLYIVLETNLHIMPLYIAIVAPNVVLECTLSKFVIHGFMGSNVL